MGIIRLSLVTVAGLGAALYYFGDAENTDVEPIGRETALNLNFLPDMSLRTDQAVASALTEALSSDASPDTATILRAAATGPAMTPAPAAAEPEAQIIRASMETGGGTGAEAPTAPQTNAVPERPEAPDLLYVTGSYVNVRTTPTLDAPVLISLSAGTAVQDLGASEGSWREIMLIDTGARGYMSGDFLSEQAPR